MHDLDEHRPADTTTPLEAEADPVDYWEPHHPLPCPDQAMMMRTITPPDPTTVNPGHPETHPDIGMESSLERGTQDLAVLTLRDLITLLSRTEDQTRAQRHDTLPNRATEQLLRYQHAILTKLRRRTRLEPNP